MGSSSTGQKGNLAELKSRLLFVLIAIVIYRFGTYVSIPGVDESLISEMINGSNNNILGLFNIFSGGSLSRASIFALGIVPYISASIIMQILSIIHQPLVQLKKEGERGRQKISQYTRYLTLVLSTVQALSIVFGLPQLIPGLVKAPDALFYVVAIISLVTGTMFLMWLGEQITERGIGNGISILIFVGIVAGLPSAIGSTFEAFREGQLSAFVVLFLLLLVISVIAFVVFVERAQRRIVINYAKKVQSGKMMGAQSSHLPLKLNMSGVIPAIFASSIVLFPGMIASIAGEANSAQWLVEVSLALQPGQPLYILIYGAAIVFFCFFYTALIFNPKETAEQLKKQGASIPGIRPGERSAKYLDDVVTRLTLSGSLYILLICLIPEFLLLAWNVKFYFGGTSILIIVVVIMDFIAQVQTHIMSSQYGDALKKANLQGYKK